VTAHKLVTLKDDAPVTLPLQAFAYKAIEREKVNMLREATN